MKKTTCFFLAVLSSSGLHAARAQAQGVESTSSQYELALQRVLEEVANPERSFEFVEAAVAAGDLRGAAAALERILLIDPRLANIQLELGVLYLRMGNGALAQYHIREALRASNVPETVRVRAERLLARAGEEGSRNTFRFESSLGYRRDSNANAGPSSNSVYVLDAFTLQPTLRSLTTGGETQDSAFDMTAGLAHVFALPSERGSSWDTDVTGYLIRYSDLEALNQHSAGVQTGPTWVFAGTPDAPFSLRPSVTYGKAWLDGEDYFDYRGGTLALNAFWSTSLLTQVQLGREDREFEDRSGLLLSDRSGDYTSAFVRQLWQLGPWQLNATVNGLWADTTAAYQSYDQLGGSVGARFFGALGALQRPWNAYLNVAYRVADYDAADVFVHPGMVREDERMDLSAGAVVALTRAVSMQIDVVYTDNESNLPNYRYDNVSAGVRLLVRL